MKIHHLLTVAVTATVLVFPVAASQVFVTPAGATTLGGPVDAKATFTASSGMLTIELVDLLANPTNVAQLLSDLDFSLSVSGTSTLTSSSASMLTVNGNGTFTPGGTGSTGWLLQPIGDTGVLTLCDLCAGAAGPSNLIIGPADGSGVYSNANGSIAGNGPHNPFLNQTAMFVISNANITADTTVSNVVFSFGTAEGINVTGVPEQSDVPGGVPEPSTFALCGLGALGTFVGMRRSRKARA